MPLRIFFLFVALFGVMQSLHSARSEPAATDADPIKAVTDPGAIRAARLFSEICVAHMGKPDEVRVWASAKRLPEITKKELTDAFVGLGGKGAAWLIPTPNSKEHLALSIKGETRACAVWTDQADPEQIKAYFVNLVEGVKRSGLTVRREPDVANELGRAMTFEVGKANAPFSFVFLLITSEKPNTFFQVSMQASVAAPSGKIQ